MFWRKNNKEKTKYRCSRCGKEHDEVPALSFIYPYHYDILSNEAKNENAEISDDFCIIYHSEQTDFFIRTVLTIQIIDYCESLDYGIWVSLSEKSFKDYQEKFKQETNEPVYFGMVCNEIRDYDESTLGLHVNVRVRNGGIRPEIIPHQAEHQLIKDWENGISFEDALERIYRTEKNTQ
jgi:hypothetical protein